MDRTSRTIARIAGPTALALATTEPLNMHIFAAQTAPTVYLNGAVLFVGGLAIMQAHTRWRPLGALLVTLTGWGAAGLGLLRMGFPDEQQVEPGLMANAIFMVLFALGAALTYAGYRPPGRRDET